ncbi:MAG: ribose 5-phosphate isomerase B [Candidatus Gracilibacteria bacterium]
MIYLGSDHAGYDLKNILKDFLQQELKVEFLDLGVFSTDSMDYPDIAREVAEKVSENQATGDKGILVCGTGTGMCIVANKLDGIRAAPAVNEEMAEMARRHNDANVICLGSRLITPDMAKKLVKIFIETKFDAEERHQRRVDKITQIEKDRK